jgi:hypothetical protein
MELVAGGPTFVIPPPAAERQAYGQAGPTKPNAAARAMAPTTATASQYRMVASLLAEQGQPRPWQGGTLLLALLLVYSHFGPRLSKVGVSVKMGL